MSINDLSAEEQAALVASYEANKYKDQRRRAYPTIEDQLDKIYHEGIDAWKAEIKAVKDANPKPKQEINNDTK